MSGNAWGDGSMSSALAVDLGSVRTRVAGADGELLFEEATLAAIDHSNGRLLAFGDEAIGLGARSAGRVHIERPVRGGKLVDVELAEAVIADVLRRVGIGRTERTDVACCAHVDMSDVQRRALERAFNDAGARNVRFVEQPIAVAIGAGLEITEPSGTMVVDVGGGTSDLGIMALGGLVSTASLPLGGLVLDELVRNHLARAYGVALDRSTAEGLRRRLGIAKPVAEVHEIEVAGRDRRSGRPLAVVVDTAELSALLAQAVEPLFNAAVRCVTSAPPDLANDLLGAGIVLAGGASRLVGLDQRLASVTGVPVHVPPDPARLAVRGAAACLRAESPSLEAQRVGVRFTPRTSSAA